MKPEELQSVLCSADKLERYFIFPPGYDTRELANRFCGNLGEEFVTELKGQLKVNWLLDEVSKIDYKCWI